MVYDSIENIETYKKLSPDLFAGLRFLQQASTDLAIGVHQINPRVKAIVSEYETKQENKHGYEAHKKNIDIQYLLRGEERVACLPIERLKETMPYCEEKDAAFYSADIRLQPSYLSLLPGYFAMFFPQDGHMPQLNVDNSMMVKKVVIKVELI